MDDLNRYRPKVPAKRSDQAPASDEGNAKTPTRAEALRRLETKLGRKFAMGTVYLLVDCSSSMDDGTKMHQARKGAAEFAAEATKKRYATGVIRFGSDVTLILKPSTDLSAVQTAVDKLEPIGTTNMSAAFRMARNALESLHTTRAVVLVTDGMPDDPEDAIRAADDLKSSGVDIIAVGTDDADRRFLEHIASASGLADLVSSADFGTAIAKAATLLALPPSA